MNARAEGAQLPLAVLRWIVSSNSTTTLRGVVTTFVRDRIQRISLPRMSDEWLLRHERDTRDDI